MIPGIAYRPYSCCCRAKVSDSAGGPDHSFFAPSDQLSHLSNCFDLSSFSFIPSLDSYDFVALLLLLIIFCFHYSKICLPSPIAVSLFHRSRLCFRIIFSLVITFKAPLGFPALSLALPHPALRIAPYPVVCVILPVCQVDQVTKCHNYSSQCHAKSVFQSVRTQLEQKRGDYNSSIPVESRLAQW